MNIWKALMLAACGSILLLLSCQGSRTLLCGGAGNFSCPAHMYCKLNEGCGGIDLVGTCTVRPESCPIEEKPVCGCDNKTYDSACFAGLRGITIKAEGACL